MRKNAATGRQLHILLIQTLCDKRKKPAFALFTGGFSRYASRA